MADEPRPAPDRRVAVLISGAGTLLQALLDAGPAVGFGVCGVVADRPRAPGLERALHAGVPTAVISLGDFPDRPAWDAAVAREIGAFNPDLVVLAGFMRILGAPVLAGFGGRILNTHPALLPSFPGPHPVRDALRHGVKVSGCSVILVNDGIDTGPIVAQRSVEVADDDDEASLHERIKVVERALLVDVVGRMSRNGWTVNDRKVTLG